VLGIAIGIIAGCGAIVFDEALQAATALFLHLLAGYRVPTPFLEGGVAPGAGPSRPWALPLIAAGGALLGAVLVYRVAPEAEGHGTDAAISAVHHDPRGVRFRTVLVKLVASALTIGSGGSGGREGPTGQISAGFGSLLARVLDLDPDDARVAVATGIGAGIGSIFGAPLGGAVLAAEILYRDDFDPAALLPKSRIEELAAAVQTGDSSGAREVVRTLAPAAVRRIARRLLSDPPFRARSQILVRRYAEVIAEAARHDRQGFQAAALLATSSGRTYLLLAAASGQPE